MAAGEYFRNWVFLFNFVMLQITMLFISVAGAGYSSSRLVGEIISNAYACLPEYECSMCYYCPNTV